jgi:hypothetical protein
MLRTHKAALRGDRIEWIDTPPEPTRPTPVHITLLEDRLEPEASRGAEMGRILEQLAQGGGLAGIDAVEWPREVRQDRSLPGREE